jgi:Fic family protein
MDIKEFKSGEYKAQYQYQSFMPALVDHPWEVSDAKLASLLSQANLKLGELNAFSQLVPDINYFIMMHVSKEATSSSRIEGTQTNIEEALQQEEYIDPEKRDDWEEVQNYIKAMNNAVNSLDNLPISNRLLANTHEVLLQGVRGKHKHPGSFRRSQNWIGGSSLNDAVFIPPQQDDVPDLMADLERFLNNQQEPVPDLIKIAIAHYQFETIHPFLDGNGRIGRLLITLYLVSKNILVKPTLYLSAFFEKHKTLYYDNLMRVRTHSDLRQWLLFFLDGVRQTSENSVQTFREIIQLRHNSEQMILNRRKQSSAAAHLLTELYRQPIVDTQLVMKKLGVSKTTALRAIGTLVELNILKEQTGYKRNRLFNFEAYIELFK